MNKIKSFFLGIILLAITLVSLLIVVLTYRANDQTAIKTYIFQISSRPNLRPGPLQDLDSMKPEILRDKLIAKYVAEYFSVLPVDINIKQQKNIANLSNSSVYQHWLNGEAKTIESLAKDKIFRSIWIDQSQIQQINNDWFAVPYTSRTWTEPNQMNSDIVNEFGTINLRIRFEPGIRPKMNVRKYLESGEDPVGLFKFQVIDVKM